MAHCRAWGPTHLIWHQRRGFGRSVAVADDTAVVGAPGDDQLTGSAYVFSGVSPEIFSDGFESGDTSAWSQTVS